MQRFQYLEPPFRGADVWFDDTAQFFIRCCQGYLYNGFCFAVDALQNLQIPQNKVGFRLKRDSEAVLFNQQQRAPCVFQTLFQRHIWVAHRACADHAALSLASQSSFEQVKGVFLDLDILEIMCHLIALAPRVAVDAAVRAAAVEIHPVRRGQDSLSLNVVHAYFLFFLGLGAGSSSYIASISSAIRA